MQDSQSVKITAIVSTYNAEKFIEGCLIDLIEQSIFNKMEIIVVDSGSEENEADIVHKYQRKFQNIKYIRTDEHRLFTSHGTELLKMQKGNTSQTPTRMIVTEGMRLKFFLKNLTKIPL